jgi:hypothetical protein
MCPCLASRVLYKIMIVWSRDFGYSGSGVLGLSRCVIRYVDIDVSVQRKSSILTFDLEDGGNLPVETLELSYKFTRCHNLKIAILLLT